MKFNPRQRQVVRGWPGVLINVWKDNWKNSALGYTCGGLAAVAIDQSLCDLSSICDKIGRYWCQYRTQAPNLEFILAPVVIVVIWALGVTSWRTFQSWIHGIVIGGFFWSFVITVVVFWGHEPVSTAKAGLALLLAIVMLLLSALLRLWVAVHHEKTIDGIATAKPHSLVEMASTIRVPEAPIADWAEDRLHRSALVEVLTYKILSAKAPVIALRGSFGEGKSSVLNLLRLQLDQSAIIVSFSSWLPNSETVLANELFADIATECSKHLIVPSLRKQFRSYATILAGSVSYLKTLTDIIPQYTQRQEIRDLGEVLGRIPKRVVVLLDEIDRMQKEELLTLLKIIRGASELPNLTFVCALHQEHIEKVVLGDREASSTDFFEKFFPVTVDLPKQSPNTLKQILYDQLNSIFADSWFRTELERSVFDEGIKQIWNESLAHICTNIRKTSLLMNDVEASAKLLVGEVAPLDLCALIALRRFFPSLYELVWRHAVFFSNAHNSWRAPLYRSVQERALEANEIRKELTEVLTSPGGDAAKALVKVMFPIIAEELFDNKPGTGSTDSSWLDEAEGGKRIAHPDFFPIYFRFQVPETVFSSRELERFIQSLKDATSPVARRTIFDRRFRTLEPGSVLRYDFIHRLSLRLSELPIEVAKAVALAISANSASLGDELLVSERRRALVGIFAVAQQLSDLEVVNEYLGECIETSSSDLFAENIFTLCTTERASNRVLLNYRHVQPGLVIKAFSDRMTTRYSDDGAPPPQRSNLHALHVWSGINEIERQKEVSYLERYIGQNRARLAEVFDLIMPRDTPWNVQSIATLNRMIPVETLREMFAKFQAEASDGADEQTLSRLRQFLEAQPASGEDGSDRVS